MWHHVKVLRVRSDLFAGTETLSLSVNKPIAKQILVGGPCPDLGGRGRVRGSTVFAGTETLSLSVNEPIAKHIFVGGTVPQFGGGG